ncbi:hypothetical protein Pyrfu_0410 [Pyrolobus fumarii 1A]|uniref:Uncharacterized protein n=1 Tax=Pyrolobus fumarii (strain DSM 11204 / 1A) TaxID=694429 RepID=G0EG33_PYRF1|nr:hypothetical protein [Pyrolobus fumarii]AEM38281.1 hypothetical protein Pyrfu_0410 [Pyrolobus fumarii 1A]
MAVTGLSEEERKALRKLREMVEKLTKEEYITFRYLWEHISVGEIIAEQELRIQHGIMKPDLMFKRIREKGLMEKGEGCYNLASWLRPLRKKLGSSLERVLSLAA